eukprot:Unigene12717_Nuclearia_a/m.38635 Unigene12717_Nuclearia_a/g.38635  ORF Unigene12717_Nuclearia_a/g.38635 Unigene12717_Nuclearia_a/m.38635 type:complete len:337 (-) Unigene12717_Nuclearia_a:1737-2747(-)
MAKISALIIAPTRRSTSGWSLRPKIDSCGLTYSSIIHLSTRSSRSTPSLRLSWKRSSSVTKRNARRDVPPLRKWFLPGASIGNVNCFVRSMLCSSMIITASSTSASAFGLGCTSYTGATDQLLPSAATTASAVAGASLVLDVGCVKNVADADADGLTQLARKKTSSSIVSRRCCTLPSTTGEMGASASRRLIWRTASSATSTTRSTSGLAVRGAASGGPSGCGASCTILSRQRSSILKAWRLSRVHVAMTQPIKRVSRSTIMTRFASSTPLRRSWPSGASSTRIQWCRPARATAFCGTCDRLMYSALAIDVISSSVPFSACVVRRARLSSTGTRFA